MWTNMRCVFVENTNFQYIWYIFDSGLAADYVHTYETFVHYSMFRKHTARSLMSTVNGQTRQTKSETQKFSF